MHDQMADLDALLTGSAHWLTSHLPFFDPRRSGPKATLELGLLCRCWDRARPADQRLRALLAMIETIWQHPDFIALISADKAHARLYRLLHLALAPPGAAASLPPPSQPDAIAFTTIDGSGLSREHLAYLRLETRYFLDLAHVDHQMESYGWLARSTILGRLTSAGRLTILDRYLIAHAIFYLSDFGFSIPRLTQSTKAQIYGVVSQLSAGSLRRADWDLTGMLLLARFCLNHHSATTPLGDTMLRSLVMAQRADGGIPGSSSAPSGQDMFGRTYHSTLISALAALIVSSA